MSSNEESEFLVNVSIILKKIIFEIEFEPIQKNSEIEKIGFLAG